VTVSVTAILRRLAVGLAPLVLGAVAAQAQLPARTIGWDELRPAPVAEEDPFAGLSDEQFEALRGLVRSRVLEAQGFPVTDAVRRQRAETTRQLQAQGVDVDTLLARREILIAQRRRAAEAGVAGLDGEAVRLAGYLLPTGVDGRPVRAFLLVPSIGACSHTRPPPPNQIVVVRAATPAAPPGLYAPAWIRGTLRVSPERTSVHVVDGELVVDSTYAIDDAEIVVIQSKAADR
jgi:hypothetical protein